MLRSVDVQGDHSRGDHSRYHLSDPQLHSPTTSTFSARTHRERLNDPSASMLDLDDDSRLSVASDYYDDERSTLDNNDPRMSYLGPNLRFHSRAPWEMDEGTLEEEEGPSHSSLLPSKKVFGFSSSPRTSNARRPSVDSVRSQAKSKQSFETTASQMSYPRGALYALAQESLSTSSLGASTGIQKPPRSKFPLSRVQSDPPNNTAPSSPVALSPNHAPLTLTSHDTLETRPPPISHRRPTYGADGFHPYANPDLVSQVPDSRHHSPPNQSIYRSDSIGTITDSIAHGMLSRSGTKSTLAPAISASSVTRNRVSTISGKDISSPISLVNNTPRLDSKPHSSEEPFLVHSQSGVDNLPGWTDRVISPGFSLISLEEARAQRMRSATAQPTIHHLQTSAISSDILASSPYDSGYGTEHENSSPHSQRSRARSISAGAKAKGALQSIVGNGQSKLEADTPLVGHGKTIKHKKSGFMRLFNGGRGQDKEEKTPLPPVPSLSDAYTVLNAVQKVSKVTANYTPVADLSPSFQDTPLPSSGHSSPMDTAAPIKPSPNSKRPIPPLSINTQSQSSNRATFASDDDFQTRTAPATHPPQQPWLDNPIPQSAPANVTEFPALKLRPVSTVFSAHFGDHFVLPEPRPSLETDVGTPGSLTRVFSPVTPGSSTLSDRSSNDPKLIMTPISEDQSSVISALQEQIANAKLVWQRQIWELESQVRDLKAEVDDLRKTEIEGTFCESCGRGHLRKTQSNRPDTEMQDGKTRSVVNRPRARTGTSSSRFGSALS